MFSLWESRSDASWTVVPGDQPPVFYDGTPQDPSNELIWTKLFSDFGDAFLEAERTMQVRDLVESHRAICHARECEYANIRLKGFTFEKYNKIAEELSDTKAELCRLLERGPVQFKEQVWEIANFV